MLCSSSSGAGWLYNRVSLTRLPLLIPIRAKGPAASRNMVRWEMKELGNQHELILRAAWAKDERSGSLLNGSDSSWLGKALRGGRRGPLHAWRRAEGFADGLWLHVWGKDAEIEAVDCAFLGSPHTTPSWRSKCRYILLLQYHRTLRLCSVFTRLAHVR